MAARQYLAAGPIELDDSTRTSNSRSGFSSKEIESIALNRFHGTITKVESVDGSLRVFVDAGVVNRLKI